MEQKDSHSAPQTQANDVVVEPMDQGLVTTLWPDIEAAVTASGFADEITKANVLGQIRARRLQPYAAWQDGAVRAIVIIGREQDGYTEERVAVVHALHGHLEVWPEAARQLEEILRFHGYKRIIAWTDNPRVATLCAEIGWPTRTVAVKEL